jgi:trehalose/maltose transport system substrate-binding protein
MAGEVTMGFRRAAVRWLVVVALLFAVPAGTGGTAAGGSDGRGPITFVTGKDLTGYLQPLLDGWNRTHPGRTRA